MLTVKKSIDINAPAEKIYNYVYGVISLPEVWPSLEEVNNMTTLPDGKLSFDTIYKMAGMRLKVHNETEVGEPCRRTVTRSTGGIEALIVWTFEPLSGDVTRVSFQTDYTVPIPIIGRLAENVVHGMNDRESEVTLANLKVRMEA
jgi:uncharacterized membrane protein